MLQRLHQLLIVFYIAMHQHHQARSVLFHTTHDTRHTHTHARIEDILHQGERSKKQGGRATSVRRMKAWR